MFTEAASLLKSYCQWLMVLGHNLVHYLRSVVIIAIDMKHLVTLDTENTVYHINKQGIPQNA